MKIWMADYKMYDEERASAIGSVRCLGYVQVQGNKQKRAGDVESLIEHFQISLSIV